MGDKQIKDKLDYKARLENKLYLARENPEPIFDLSDCHIKFIPKNIFSLCKVFRKEALYLQKNFLSSLSSGGSLQDLSNIKILDISSNNFSELPSDINQLIMLKVLNVSNNKLQALPMEIGSLENLVVLDVSCNKLKQLPDSIGSCKNMEVLKLSSNQSLKQLPVALSKLHSLAVLDIDPTITYPPREICQKGIDAILNYFIGELDEDEIPSTSCNLNNSCSSGAYSKFQEKITLHEKEKAKKQEERLAIEKMLQENQQKVFELQQKLKNNRSKLIEDVKNQQQMLNAELVKLQEKKESNRASLIRLCRNEEVRANEIISKILESNKEKKTIETLMEKDRMLEEEMLFRRSVETKAIEKKQILSSMDELMRKEIETAQKINASRRLHAVRSLASEIASQDKALNTFISKYEEAQGHLIDVIRRDEEFQKTAVASLLEKSDSTSWKLAKQIAMVERHLADLTRLEISKRKLESDCQLVELSKNRNALTKVLMDLFDQQAERREHLVATIRRMEILRETGGGPSETFWMDQYTKLLSSKSHEMVIFLEAVDPNLVHHLFLNGVFHYLPLLKNVALCNEKLENLNTVELKKLGVKSTDASAILNAIHSFLSQQSSVKPSAPVSIEPCAPELPVIAQESAVFPAASECVVCLEFKPNVIFFPCGHICCCYKCFTSITHCPLCRAYVASVREVATF